MENEVTILTTEQIYSLCRAAGFPCEVAVTMTAIALRESGGNPRARNSTPPDDSYGLFQINMYRDLGFQRRKMYNIHRNEELFDPALNTRVAYLIWDHKPRNLEIAWAINRSPYKERYEKFLPAVREVASQIENPSPATDRRPYRVFEAAGTVFAAALAEQAGYEAVRRELLEDLENTRGTFPILALLTYPGAPRVVECSVCGGPVLAVGPEDNEKHYRYWMVETGHLESHVESHLESHPESPVESPVESHTESKA